MFVLAATISVPQGEELNVFMIFDQKFDFFPNFVKTRTEIVAQEGPPMYLNREKRGAKTKIFFSPTTAVYLLSHYSEGSICPPKIWRMSNILIVNKYLFSPLCYFYVANVLKIFMFQNE